MEKNEVKEKMILKIKNRMIEEMAGRKKCQTIENDKWRRKEYVKESNSGTIKDMIKIRLHIGELKANYGRKGLGNRCPMHQSVQDTTLNFLECNKRDNKFNFNDERGKEWGETVKMYRKKQVKQSNR